MVLRVTHHIECCHETQNWRDLALGNPPVLVEKVEWKNTGDVLVANALDNLGIPDGLILILSVTLETAMGLLRRFLSHLEFGSLQVALDGRVSRNYPLDNEATCISNRSLWPINIKTDAHRVAVLHGVEDVVAGQAAITDFFSNFLVFLTKLVHFELLDDLIDLRVEPVVQILVLQGSLVEHLLEVIGAFALDGLERGVINLSNNLVGKVAQVLDAAK